jgi:two-component system phosphate regulon sensor histidine kinase PhoR
MSDTRRGLSVKLLAVYTLAFVVIIGLFGALVDSFLRRQSLDELTSSLIQQASVVEVAIRGETDLVALVDELATRSESRVTVIAIDGWVLADSAEDASTMENHSQRPEIVAALAGEVGVARRQSSTVNEALLYVARPLSQDRIVRLAIPEALVAERLGEIRVAVITGAGLAGLIGIILVWLISRRIARPLQEMTDAAESVAAGNLAARVPRVDTKELDRMAGALNHMAAELGNRIEASEGQARLLDQVLGAVRQAVVVIDEDDQILYSNPAAAGMIRIPDSLGGLTPHGLQTLVREARSGANRTEGLFDHGSPTRILQAAASPFPQDRRVLLAISDITETTRVDAMRRDFVSSASHELKTPVAAILASAEALQMALARDPGSAERFGEQIERLARQLAKLVGDLLDLSRLEASEPAHELVRIDQVAEEEVSRVRPAAELAGLTLTATSSAVSVSGSRRDLGLAIRNLLDNAVRHTPAGGTVDVKLRSDNGEVVLEVIDSGEGIPKRELPRIFERFYRVDTARARATGGTGLGLAIVRHVVERHGGSVHVESDLGQGSTFRLRIPQANQAPSRGGQGPDSETLDAKRVDGTPPGGRAGTGI